MTCESSIPVTSSPELRDGLTLFPSPDGSQLALFGLPPSPASPSRSRGKAKALPTSATCGPSSESLSPSAALQYSLASKLAAVLDVNGSPEYVLTWKSWDIGSGPPICALRASRRRTSDSGCSGWPTPTGQDNIQVSGQFANPHSGTTLGGAVRLAGWSTPSTEDHKSDGPKTLAEWAEAQAENRPVRRSAQRLRNQVVMLAGWPTPNLPNGGRSSPSMSATGVMPDGTKRQACLEHVARLAGWATPAARDWRDGRASQETMERNARPLNEQAVMLASGTTTTSSPAPTEKRGVLNVEFTRWLQGFPPEWGVCAPMAMPSSRPSGRRS